jgi:hypothetical protein
VQDGLAPQVDRVSRLVTESVPKMKDGKNAKQGISDEDLGNLLRLMQKQKTGIDVLTGSIQTSTRELLVMERELD